MGSGSKQTTKTSTDINSITPGLQPLLDAMVQKASWISNGGQKVLNPATGQMEDQINPFTTPAAASQDQLNAYQGVRDMQGSYDDIIKQALGLQTDAMTRAGRAPTQEDIAPYKNLYLQNVLGDTVRAMQENSDRNMRDIGSQATLVNSFGGSRQALLESQNQYNTTRGIGEETNKVNADSFTSALQNYLSSIGLRSATSQAGMDRVGQAQSTRLKELASLENIGISQQDLEQKNLDQHSNEWLRLQDLPYKQLGALATASGAFPYQALTNTQTTQTSTNPLNQILGALTTGAGLLTGNPVLGAAVGSSASGGYGKSGLSSLWGSGWKKGGFIKAAVDRQYARGGIVKDNQGFDIDTNRPVVNNEDGSVSTESTITVGIDGRFYNVPTIYNGKRVRDEDAVNAAKMQLERGKVFPNFKTEEEALIAAKDRSQTIGKKRGFAYGGRVGNPFTQSFSSEVIDNTQNPYSNPGQGGESAMATINNNAGSAALPGQNALSNPLVDAVSPLMNNPNSDMVDMTTPVSPDMLMPKDTGGGPVAQLLGMFRDGVRNPQNFMGNANVSPAGFAKGGSVGTAPGAQPFTVTRPAPKTGTSASGTGIMDMLTSKEGLIELGLRMMASDGNPLQALATSALGMKQDRQKAMGNPMEQYMAQLKAERLQQQMELAGEDQGLQRQMQEARLQAMDDQAAAREAAAADRDASRGLTEALGFARLGQDQSQFEQSMGMREKELGAKEPKTPKYVRPGFEKDVETANEIARGKDISKDYGDSDPSNDLISSLDSDARAASELGDEQSARAAADAAKKLKQRRVDTAARLKNSFNTSIPAFTQ